MESCAPGLVVQGGLQPTTHTSNNLNKQTAISNPLAAALHAHKSALHNTYMLTLCYWEDGTCPP